MDFKGLFEFMQFLFEKYGALKAFFIVAGFSLLAAFLMLAFQFSKIAPDLILQIFGGK